MLGLFQNINHFQKEWQWCKMLITINKSLIMLHYIKTFFEVANRLSMAETARRLKITPAAVSKHIQALEKQLGVDLFKRSTRKLELTEFGKIYYPHAKTILEAAEDGLEALSQSKEEPCGHLKVACGSQFVDETLLPNLKTFIKKYPKISLELILSQTIPDLEKENIDVIVGFTRGMPLNCVQRKLFQTKWVLCASKEYLETYETPKKPIDLEKHRLITHSNRDPHNIITFQNGESVKCHSILCFNDTRLMKKCALDGLGVTYLHDYIVANELKEGRLVSLLNDKVDSQEIKLYIAYLQSKHLHIKIRKFVDFIIEIYTRKLKNQQF